MSEFLLELYSEEIPCDEQLLAESNYLKIFTRFFSEEKITFSTLKIASSQQRITVFALDLPLTIKQEQKIIKGPKTNISSKTILESFCKKNNILLSQLEKKEFNKELYWIFNKKACEIKTSTILKSALPKIISSHRWKKSLLCKDNHLNWIRPMKNILCLFNNQILNFKYFYLNSNNITYGHKFLSHKTIEVKNHQNYINSLKKNKVIVLKNERRDKILLEAKKILQEKNISDNLNKNLLEEVLGRFEFPQVLLGKIDDKYLSLPTEIIRTVAKNEKYFITHDENKKILPYFLFCINTGTKNIDNIIKWHQNSFNNRLYDAEFFFKQDLKEGLENQRNLLKKIIFQNDLGSIFEKTNRLTKLAQYFAPDNNALKVASKFCKCDLASKTIIELPELEGKLVYYFAKNASLEDKTCLYIKNQYYTNNQIIPSYYELSLLDKVDSLTGLYLKGYKPQANKDPYGIRRYVLSIIKIVIEKKISLPLTKIFCYATKLWNQYICHSNTRINELIEFIKSKHFYINQTKFNINILKSVFFNNLPNISEKENKQQNHLLQYDIFLYQKLISCVNKFINEHNITFQYVVSVFKRLLNLTKNSTKKEILNTNKSEIINSKNYTQEEEKNLIKQISFYDEKYYFLQKKQHYLEILKELKPISTKLEIFLNNVKIYNKQGEKNKDRYNILLILRLQYSNLVDFEHLIPIKTKKNDKQS